MLHDIILQKDKELQELRILLEATLPILDHIPEALDIKTKIENHLGHGWHPVTCPLCLKED